LVRGKEINLLSERVARFKKKILLHGRLGLRPEFKNKCCKFFYEKKKEPGLNTPENEGELLVPGTENRKIDYSFETISSRGGEEGEAHKGG